MASQTMVSAAFSIIKQSMMLNCFPRMRVIYTNGNVRRLRGVLPVSFTLRLVLNTPGQAFTHHGALLPHSVQHVHRPPRLGCRDRLRVTLGSDGTSIIPSNLQWLQP